MEVIKDRADFRKPCYVVCAELSRELYARKSFTQLYTQLLRRSLY